MATGAQELEHELIHDLGEIEERFRDEKFSVEAYRSLTERAWRKEGGPEGHVALSWARTEAVIDGLRERVGRPPLELAQTGGEGELSDDVAEELGRFGWTSEPFNTSRHDDRHASEPEQPPGLGERQTPPR